MFKKIIFVFLLLPFSMAYAQIGPDFREIRKTVICGPLETIMKGLADPDIQEKPVWVGEDEKGQTNYSLFYNEKTKAFTLVQFTKTIGCILGIGYKSEFHLGRPL
jgi:hypothetical protein